MILKGIGYAVLMLLFMWFMMWVTQEMQHQSELDKARKLEAMNMCVEQGGEVEIRSTGVWSCHFKGGDNEQENS